MADIATSCPIIILEGNIAAGKSTLAQTLGEVLNYRVMLEPTAQNPYLEKFYANPQKYALKLQLWILRQRFLTAVEALRHVVRTGTGVILDRSVFSDSVFARVGYRDKFISEEGYAFYNKLRNQMLRKLPVPHCTLFLRVSASECLRRVVHVRQRECEKGIPLEYLESLGSAYDEFLEEMRDSGSEVVDIDWNNFGNVGTVAREVADHIASKGDSSPKKSADLAAFVNDEKAINRTLSLDYVIDEARDEVEAPLFDLKVLQEREQLAHELESVDASRRRLRVRAGCPVEA